jgi:transcriptional regulator with XRE-family HTH domain
MIKDEIRENFANNIRIRRIYSGMSQKQLADAAQIALSSVSVYENGVNLPPVDAAYRIASALGVSLNDMFIPITIKICTTSSDDKGDAR